MAISQESIKYSLKNIAHRKTRSFLTVLSIFIGIATIFIFISFGWGLYDYVNNIAASSSADKITIQPKGNSAPGLDNTFALTEEDVRATERTQGVFEASGVYIKAAQIEKNEVSKYVFLQAYDPKKPLVMELMSIDLSQGRELQSGDNSAVVLGYSYQFDDKVFAKKLGLNEKVTIQGKDFRIVGFYEEVGNPQDDSNIYMTNDAIKTIYPNITGYAWIIARVDQDNIKQVISDVEKSVRKSRNLEEGKEDFFVASFEDLLNSYMSALNIVVGFVILIALISVLVSAINTANTMITSVLERTKEIGVIKAIGAKNSEIFNIFLFESGFLGFIAGCLGVLLGWILTSIGGNILSNLGWGFLSPHYSISLFGGLILFATLTGAISGVIPAINASKINIVDALRYE